MPIYPCFDEVQNDQPGENSHESPIEAIKEVKHYSGRPGLSVISVTVM